MILSGVRNIPSNWIVTAIWLFLFEFILTLLGYFEPTLLVVFGVGILSFIIFYLLFFHSPALWIYLLLIASALDTWGRITDGLTIFHVFFFFSLVAYLVYHLYNHTLNEVITNTPINRYVFIYLSMALVSLLYSPNIESGFQFLSVTFALFLFFMLIVNLINKNFHDQGLIIVFLVTNIFITFFIIYQTLKGEFIPGVTDTTVAVENLKFYRAAGTFEDPNVAATYLASGVILSYSRLIHSDDSKLLKLFYLLGIIISSLGVFITFSRSGIIFEIFGIIFCTLFIKNKKLLTAIALTIAGLVFLLLISPFGALVLDRFLSSFNIFQDYSIKVRLSLMLSGLKMFLDSPVWGIGYRGFPIVYDYYTQSGLGSGLLNIKESHNLYITVLAEFGIGGLIVIGLWFKRIIKDCLNFIKIKINHPRKAALVGSFSLFIAFILNFIYYGNLFPMFNLIWLNIGLIYSVILNSPLKNNNIKSS